MPLFIGALRTLLTGLIPKMLKGASALITAAFLTMFGQLVIKLLLSLGIGFYTFAELNGFFETLLQQYRDAYNSTPATILAFLDMAGLTTGVNTMLSGVSFLVSYYSSRTAITFLGRAIT